VRCKTRFVFMSALSSGDAWRRVRMSLSPIRPWPVPGQKPRRSGLRRRHSFARPSRPAGFGP